MAQTQDRLYPSRSGTEDMASAAAGANPFMLQVRGLTKQFAGFVAVEDVDLAVRRNTIHGLIGPNGAGKSTVFDLVSKFLQPTSGRILFKDEDITAQAPEDVALKGLVRSFQTSAVFRSMTVHENVRLALQRPAGNWLRLWRSETSLHCLHDRVEALLAAVGLLDFHHHRAAELPYGRKRALEIATTLALEPEMLLLDEPMAGLGREDIGRISELIRQVSRDRTVLMVEHNLGVVSSLCDRVTVLTRGRVLAEGSYDEIAASAEVRRAYMGAVDA